MKKYFVFLLAFSLGITLAGLAASEEYCGVEFPKGASSFSDTVVSYTPGTGRSMVDECMIQSHALGVPECSGPTCERSVSLGNSGILVVLFTDNLLTTSGDNNLDLWIFEEGSGSEKTDVYISQDQNEWIYVGRTLAGANGIDIDAYIGSGVILGGAYSYVRLEDANSISSNGSDINAIGASSSIPLFFPVANAGPDKIICNQICAEVVLDGRKSEDPNGEIVSYNWELDHDEDSCDETASEETPTVTTLCPGTYVVTLTVTDDDELTATDEMILRVLNKCDPCAIMQGDFDSDGDVDGDDLQIFSGHFGTEPILTP